MSLTQAEFDAALKQWKDETSFHSFPWTVLRGDGFEKVKAFGVEAIPFLLRALQTTEIQTWGIHWYLPRLTGVDNLVAERDGGFIKGHVAATTAAWIAWGVKQGYLEGK